MLNRNSAIVAAALIVAGLAGTSFATAGRAEPGRPQQTSQQTDVAIWASTCEENVCESFDRDLRRAPTTVGMRAVAAEADALRQALSAALWSQPGRPTPTFVWMPPILWSNSRGQAAGG